MNKIEMYTSLNKGVPNYVPIKIDSETLLRECADDKDVLVQSLRSIGNAHQRRIANIAGVTEQNMHFLNYFKFRLINKIPKLISLFLVILF
jgi:hypothetical protein